MSQTKLQINDLESELLEKINQYEQLRSFLLANVSHEFRTPLNAIVGFTDLLDDPASSQTERKNYIREIRQGCDNMVELINSFMEAARLIDNKEKLSLENCNIANLFESVCHRFSKILNNSDKQLDFIVRENVGWHIGKVLLDPIKLRRVLEILLNNALKFTSEGKIEAGFSILDDKNIEFFVKDSGIGIPKQYLDTVFDLFVQSESGLNRSYSGIGLGLPIARKLVELMGGQLSVASESGKGTLFTFNIPYRNAAESHLSIENNLSTHNYLQTHKQNGKFFKNYGREKIQAKNKNIKNYIA